MNKRKTTSIALAAAVAISTVQLAYPANVFAQENVTKVTTNSKDVLTAEGTKENPWDVSATDSDNVKVYTETNADGTYTLHITGKGKMKDFEKVKTAPWFSIKDALTKITAVEIDDGVTKIGTYALSKITGLTTINGNNTTETNRIEFPAQLTDWGFSMNGSGLTGVIHFPKDCKLENPDSLNIYGNNNITGINWTNYPLTEIMGHWTEYGTKHENLKELNLDTLPSRVTKIGDYAFKFFCGENITIPDTSKNYGEGVFTASELKDVTINIEKEGSKLSENMFSSSKSLSNVKFVGNNLTDISGGSFHDTNLNYMAIPYGVERIITNSENKKEHDSTFGINTGSNIDNNVAFVFPSTLSSLVEFNNMNEVFLNRSASNVKILSPSTLDLSNIGNGGLKGLDSGKTIANDFDGLYRYTLGKNVTYGDTVKIFKVTDFEGKESTLPTEFGTISYEFSNKNILDENLKAVSLGSTKVDIYLTKPNSNDKTKIAETTINVNAPEGTIATVGNIPYTDLQTAINKANGKIVTIEKNIELSDDLEINGKNNVTIDFKGKTLSSKSKYTDKSLIKITDSIGITIKNANFDLSSGGEVAILVDGTNNASNVTLVGAINATRGTKKAPVVKIVGDKSEVNIEEGAKLNDDLTPSIGKEDDASIILGKDSLASNIHNKNNSSGGGNYYPSKPSKPIYTHEKIEGLDRYETAAKIADKLGSYDTAVLVNATSTMSDGLSAAGLAGKEDAAILLVKKDSIPKATMDRLKKVKKVYIIGGENAISKKVSDEITKNVAKVEVERLGGKTRVETSELVAKEIGNYSNAFVVNGFKGEADAMSASSIAARYEAPILLTNGKTSTHAKKSGVEYYVVGGTSVVNKSIADKYNAKVLAGKDRYATNREVIDEFYSGSDKLYIANGDKLVDALTASPLAKNHGIVLVNKKSDKSILKDKNIVRVGGMDFEIDFE